jgi:hypothetical protein
MQHIIFTHVYNDCIQYAWVLCISYNSGILNNEEQKTKNNEY